MSFPALASLIATSDSPRRVVMRAVRCNLFGCSPTRIAARSIEQLNDYEAQPSAPRPKNTLARFTWPWTREGEPRHKITFA